MKPTYLTVAQYAKSAGISRQHAYWLIKKGRLKTKTIGTFLFVEVPNPV